MSCSYDEIIKCWKEQQKNVKQTRIYKTFLNKLSSFKFSLLYLLWTNYLCSYLYEQKIHKCFTLKKKCFWAGGEGNIIWWSMSMCVILLRIKARLYTHILTRTFLHVTDQTKEYIIRIRNKIYKIKFVYPRYLCLVRTNRIWVFCTSCVYVRRSFQAHLLKKTAKITMNRLTVWQKKEFHNSNISTEN